MSERWICNQDKKEIKIKTLFNGDESLLILVLFAFGFPEKRGIYEK